MAERALNILIAEDDPASLEALQLFLESGGHTVISVPDGVKALALMDNFLPDMVLLDVGMPGLDGLEVTKRIRERFGPRWVPIIFLSARAHQMDILEGLAAGADDYLTKPVSYPILTAKIKAMQRICNLQTELVRYYDQTEDENSLAQTILERLIHSDARNDPTFKWVVMPLQRFSGDQILVQRNPDGILTILLADAMGHGLPAAITLMPMLKTFSKLASMGVPLGQLAREMNSEHRLMLPSSRFIAALLIQVDPRRKTMEVWNGGIPICFVLDSKPSVVHRFESVNPPIGIVPDLDFEDQVESLPWEPRSGLTLVATSDGMLDAATQLGIPFGEDGLIQALLEGPVETCYERALAGVYIHLQGHPAADDISLLSLRSG